MLPAADGGSIAAVSEQIERALFLDMRLNVRRTPAPRLQRRRNTIGSASDLLAPMCNLYSQTKDQRRT